MIVFDDSSPANQEKYFPLLEQTKTHNDLFYEGALLFKKGVVVVSVPFHLKH
jgi:hypothetical protein